METIPGKGRMLDAEPDDHPRDIELETDERVPIRDIREPRTRIADRERARRRSADEGADHDAPTPTPDSETVEAHRDAEAARTALRERYDELRARHALHDVSKDRRDALLADVIDGVAPEQKAALMARRDLVAQVDALLDTQPDAATAIAAIEKTVQRLAPTIAERRAKKSGYGAVPSAKTDVRPTREERTKALRDAMTPVFEEIRRLDEKTPRSERRPMPSASEENDRKPRSSVMDKLKRVFGGDKKDAA